MRSAASFFFSSSSSIKLLLLLLYECGLLMETTSFLSSLVSTRSRVDLDRLKTFITTGCCCSCCCCCCCCCWGCSIFKEGSEILVKETSDSSSEIAFSSSTFSKFTKDLARFKLKLRVRVSRFLIEGAILPLLLANAAAASLSRACWCMLNKSKSLPESSTP